MRSEQRVTRDSRGVALVVALMAMLLLTGLGLALVVTTSTELAIAGNFQSGQEGLYAADAALERALADLLALPDWNPVLAGLATSTFVDGPSSGARVLIDGATLDLTVATNILNCGNASSCSAAEMNAVTARRPWGDDNPRWRPYAHAPLTDMLPPGESDSPFYVVVWAADDPAEDDGDPGRDGSPPNPGAGLLTLRAEAFGPAGTRRAIEATVANRAYIADTEGDDIVGDPEDGSPALGPVWTRVLSWREVR